MNPLSAKQEYDRQFFILRVIVLGTIGGVLSTLVLMFWIYFMYLWRTWDSGKREQPMTIVAGHHEFPQGKLSKGDQKWTF